MHFCLRLVVLVSFLFPITSSADTTNVITATDLECAKQLVVKPSEQAKFAGKTLVFDTNVIINDPMSIYKYPGARIIIPGAVIPELNDHKDPRKDPKNSHAVRAFSRIVDQLISKHKTISKPAPLDNFGTTLVVDPKNYMVHMVGTSYEDPVPDNQIVANALYHTYMEPNESVYLVSDDINARITASSVEVQVMGSEYEWVTVVSEDQKEEAQIKRLRVSQADMEKFKSTGRLPIPKDTTLLPNDFAMVQLEGEDETIPSVENVVRYRYDREDPTQSSFAKVMSDLPTPLLAQPKNLEQAMAIDVMFDQSIDLIAGESNAGTGKTFISMMAGILQTRNMHKQSLPFYERMIVSRTLTQVGKVALGTLPGGEDAKLSPFNENYADAWESLMRASKKGGEDKANKGASIITSQIDSKYNGNHPTVKKGPGKHHRRTKAKADKCKRLLRLLTNF